MRRNPITHTSSLAIIVAAAAILFTPQQALSQPRYRAIKIKTEHTATPRRLNIRRQIVVPQLPVGIQPADRVVLCHRAERHGLCRRVFDGIRSVPLEWVADPP